MSEDNDPACGCRPDDIDAPGVGSPGVPLTPAQMSLLTSVEHGIDAEEESVHVAIQDALLTQERIVKDSEAGTGLAVSSAIGEIDRDLSTWEAAIGSILDKRITSSLSDILYDENTMTMVGTRMPFTTDEVAGVLMRDDPRDLLAMLTGVAVGTIDASDTTGSAATSGVPSLDATCRVFDPVTGECILPTPGEPLPPSAPPPPSVPMPPPWPDGSDKCTNLAFPVPPDYCPPGTTLSGRVDPVTGLCLPVCVGVPESPAVPMPPPESPPTPPDCECPTLPPPPAGPVPCPPGFEARGAIGWGADGKAVPVCDPVPRPPAAPPPGEPPGAACAIPHVPICVEEVRPDTLRGQFWCHPEVCENIEGIISGIELHDAIGTPMPGTFVEGERSIADYLWRALTFPVIAGYRAGEAIADAFGTDSRRASDEELGKYFSLDATGVRILSWLFTGPFGESLEHKNAFIRLGSQVASADRAERLTGFPASYLAQSSLYALQYSNPQFIPSQADLDAMYLRGRIDDPNWTCLTRANGNLADCARQVRESKELKPNHSEVMSLYLRGELTEKEFLQRMREVGVLNPEYSIEYRKLAKFIPPYTDLVSFMVRDTFDPAIVEKYKLDTNFEDKFTDQTKSWAEAQGIDTDVFRQIWRAHWKIPSNTQLYEMVNRLRHDRKEVLDWEEIYGTLEPDEITPEMPPKPQVVTLEDARQALLVNDNAPTWVDSLMAIHTHPINRTDAIDAFQANAFTEKDLFEALRDNSYSEENAERLVNIQKIKRGRRLANLTGVWTFRKIIKAYQDGTITRAKADTLLSDLLPDPAQRQSELGRADDEVHAKNRAVAIKKAKRAFFTSTWDHKRTRDYLLAHDVPEERIGDLLTQWEEDRTGRFREPTVRLLVQWFTAGVISQDDLFRRSLNLGFTEIDASRIVAQAVDTDVRRRRGDMYQTKAGYKSVVQNMKQAERSDNEFLIERRAEIIAARKKMEAELYRIDKTLADNAP